METEADGQTDLPSVSLIRRLVGCQELGEAKVGDLDMVGRLDQHVPGRQVAVHQVALFQVAHALQAHTQ